MVFFLHIKCHYRLCKLPYIYQSPIPPSIFLFLLLQSTGRGGGMGPCALSYASDGGVAMICQQGAKANQWGGGCMRGGYPLPR